MPVNIPTLDEINNWYEPWLAQMSGVPVFQNIVINDYPLQLKLGINNKHCEFFHNKTEYDIKEKLGVEKCSFDVNTLYPDKEHPYYRLVITGDDIVTKFSTLVKCPMLSISSDDQSPEYYRLANIILGGSQNSSSINTPQNFFNPTSDTNKSSAGVDKKDAFKLEKIKVDSEHGSVVISGKNLLAKSSYFKLNFKRHELIRILADVLSGKKSAQDSRDAFATWFGLKTDEIKRISAFPPGEFLHNLCLVQSDGKPVNYLLGNSADSSANSHNSEMADKIYNDMLKAAEVSEEKLFAYEHRQGPKR